MNVEQKCIVLDRIKSELGRYLLIQQTKDIQEQLKTMNSSLKVLIKN